MSEISGNSFEAWYREKEFAENIRDGTPFFNGPSKLQPPLRHSPSSLLQCSRKTAYKQLNAPEETKDPEGIFWFGSRFEEDVVLPYLHTIVGQNEYVTNSLWVDFTAETTAGEVRIKGETDPVIVDADADPVLLFEIKTKRSLEHLEAPNKHHRAQAHAYMKGLSEKYDQNLSEAVILYGGRTNLNVKPFAVEFDPWFWRDTVLGWAETHSSYRLDEELPPADPQFDWECEFCSYRNRCGEGEDGYEDSPPTGFLPLYVDYPVRKVVDYLESHQGAKLTPSLAHHFPNLADDYAVHEWTCIGCGATESWDAVEWMGDVSNPPGCPNCANPMTGPQPDDQLQGGEFHGNE